MFLLTDTVLAKFRQRLIRLTLVALGTNVPVAGQSNGVIEGVVRDQQSGEPLPSASVLVPGTGIGAACDFNGRFVVRGISPGTYTLRVSYIGYTAVELTVVMPPEGGVNKDVFLFPVGLEGEAVTVTAQARGQKEAINEQLAAQTIVNVVSSARIQELADANAAESIARLPGVSLVRDAGEGSQIVVRGLQPKYNAVTVDGVRMASSGSQDRSTDLSMISPYMLEGIEVTKAVTPDQDADVLGGSVNFKLKEAGSGKEGPGFSILSEGAFTGLSTEDRFNNYKAVVSGEGRFLDDALGVFALFNVERRNLASHDLGATYSTLGREANYVTNSLNLTDNSRDRRRVNGVVALDLRLPDGKVSLSNFLSSGSTESIGRGEGFSVDNNLRTYTLGSSLSDVSTMTNSFSVEHSLFGIQGRAAVSHTYGSTDRPDDWNVGFQLAPAGLSSFIGEADLHPQEIPRAALVDPAATILNTLVTSNSTTSERALTASIDFEMQVSAFAGVTSVIKFGGKMRRQTRLYDYDQYSGQGLGLASATFVDSLIASHFPETQQYVNTTSIPLQPFSDPAYSYEDFLGGDYTMSIPLRHGMVAEMVRFVKSQSALIAQRNKIAYFHDQFNSATRDYDGNELLSAAYLMTTWNVGSNLTVIPGLRYQRLRTSYKAARGNQTTGSATGDSYFHTDTVVSRLHENWFPAVLVRYKPVDWFDIRLSYTNTIAYPDYAAIIPRIDVSIGTAIAWNNVNLIPSRSRNYDAYLSFYDNAVGLFTVGAFLKHIDNLIYPWTFNVSGPDILNYYPPGTATTVPNGTYAISTFVNNPYRVEDVGLELDWQTHFWYLPGPLDGLVLNVNFTHVYSRAEYPYTASRRVGRVIEYFDTSYVDRLLQQPDDILNLSVGYDIDGFSVRLSMLYQGEVFSGTNFYPHLRSSTESYTRWDLSIKQDLPWLGAELYGDVNNINRTSDKSLIHASTGVPLSDQYYGLSADVGLRLQF